MKKTSTFSAIIIMIGLGIGLSGCGQKGPLIVPQPSLETPQTQEEELAPTK